MSGAPARHGVLRIAIVLALLFDVFALLVLVRQTPIVFTLFMFFGQPLMALGVLLLLGAVIADLRAKGLF